MGIVIWFVFFWLQPIRSARMTGASWWRRGAPQWLDLGILPLVIITINITINHHEYLWTMVGIPMIIWLVVTGTWMDYDFPFSLEWKIIPSDELSFFRGVGIPPTRYWVSFDLRLWILDFGLMWIVSEYAEFAVFFGVIERWENCKMIRWNEGGVKIDISVRVFPSIAEILICAE